MQVYLLTHVLLYMSENVIKTHKRLSNMSIILTKEIINI